MKEPFDLRVVPFGAVVRHEEAEPRRVERLVDRLQTDGRLANPPVVAAYGDRFVLLDGATRLAALDALGYRHVVVQVAAPDGLRLETWAHVIHGTRPERLLAVLEAVEGVTLEQDGDRQPSTMCSLSLVDGRTFSVRPEGGRHPFTALNPFVSAYLDVAPIARTTHTDLDAAIVDRPDAAALVVFPRLTVDTVFGAALDGHRLPAGITRFVVANRVISLNAPLAPLRRDVTVAEHNRWLDELVAARRAGGRIRHYPEAVFVLDD